MVNAEGPKGHQYADTFDYLATDITAPYRPERYTEVLKTALALDPRPAVVIIDSLSHMHDGPGGMLEYHDAELDRLAGSDNKARLRSTWSAWVRPKAAENEFIYAALESGAHLILCFRAKQKIKPVKGSEPIDLGWQPISSERVSFETLFTLMLPPHSKGVPDLTISEMREPFDSLIPKDQQISEATGRRLAEWARGGPGPLVEGEAATPDGGEMPVPAGAPPSTSGFQAPHGTASEPSEPPLELTAAVLIESLKQAGIASERAAAVGRELFPGRSGVKAMTAVERGELWRALREQPAEQGTLV
jgi:hypothetical protein